MCVPANDNGTTLNSKQSIQNGVTTTMSNRVYTKFRHVLICTARVEYVHTPYKPREKVHYISSIVATTFCFLHNRMKFCNNIYL